MQSYIDTDGVWMIEQLPLDQGHMIEKHLNQVSTLILIESNRRRETQS